MKILWGILIGLMGTVFVLAYAFLQPEQTVVLGENLGISDTITATVIPGG